MEVVQQYLGADLQAVLSCRQPQQICPNSWFLAASLAAPHFLYAFIWFWPKTWRSWFGKKAVDAFATCGVLGKVLQFSAVLAWFACNNSRGVCLDPAHISLLQWLAALLLVAYGQSLNVGIFSAIGHDGVYYGFKLGVKVPWVTGWPFNTVAHPQYVGSVLTVWGMAVLVWNQVPPAALATLVAYWTSLYIATGFQEQYL